MRMLRSVLRAYLLRGKRLPRDRLSQHRRARAIPAASPYGPTTLCWCGDEKIPFKPQL